jgi:outer membrane protein OmpU
VLGNPRPRTRETVVRTSKKLQKNRKNVLTLACLACACSAAHAQDSVTIYGLLNPGLTVFDNVAGGHDTTMSDGVIQPSRLGFKGGEDLGGGMRSVFQLESGFNVKSGTLNQGGALFGRQAYVGLSSKDLGTLTLGRQYSFLYDNFILMSNGLVTYNVYAFKMGDADGTGSQRMNNAIKYVSPDWHHFQFGVMHALGEVPDSSKRQSSDSVGLTYTSAHFKLTSAYSVLRDSRPALSIGTTVFGQEVNQTTFDEIKIGAVGAQTVVAKFDLHAMVSTVDYQLGSQSSRLKMFEAGAVYPLLPNLSGAVGYNYYHVENVKFNGLSVGLDYVLSKRSDLSFSYGAIKGSEGTTPQMFTAPGVSTGRSQQALSAGIRHRF